MNKLVGKSLEKIKKKEKKETLKDKQRKVSMMGGIKTPKRGKEKKRRK